ncbi:hypothetical protein [Advenella mimigardefordensis]|uniref:hypothetical protein n=1 Tax=Advenella mimigardefordensis TaxID=302406 RepID=UPI0004AFF3FB|nr:hypothetical protein [Advenella mimigardefordensis]
MQIALYTFMLTALAGLASLVAGVYVLAGTGWALCAAGASLLIVSTFIRKGLTSG